jgi:hypothetical protein
MGASVWVGLSQVAEGFWNPPGSWGMHLGTWLLVTSGGHGDIHVHGRLLECLGGTLGNLGYEPGMGSGTHVLPSAILLKW